MLRQHALQRWHNIRRCVFTHWKWLLSLGRILSIMDISLCVGGTRVTTVFHVPASLWTVYVGGTWVTAAVYVPTSLWTVYVGGTRVTAAVHVPAALWIGYKFGWLHFNMAQLLKVLSSFNSQQVCGTIYISIIHISK